MSTVLRRILMMAFIAVLAGLGVFFTALLGRRPRKQAVVPAEVLVPVLPKGPIPAKAHGGQGLAVGIVCLLVLMGSAGVIYESRNVLFGGGPREPRGPVKPLAALSPPDAGSARPQGRSDGSTTGSVRASPRADEAVTLQPSRPPAPTRWPPSPSRTRTPLSSAPTARCRTSSLPAPPTPLTRACSPTPPTPRARRCASSPCPTLLPRAPPCSSTSAAPTCPPRPWPFARAVEVSDE